jgi:hypothetical protein
LGCSLPELADVAIEQEVSGERADDRPIV